MKMTKFLQACLGVGFVMFSLAAVLYTLQPLKADQPTNTNTTGKILMHQNSFVHDGNYYFQVVVWDSETGKSKFYNMDNGKLDVAEFSLPSSPLY
jgi:hypothetical protein